MSKLNNINKDLQFYNTPEQTVNILIDFLKIDKIENLNILEPSAGQGVILKEMIKKYPNNNYYFCEFLDYNKNILENDLQGKAKFICNDFLKIKEHTELQFDLIIANPPFNKNQDITHFAKMVEICKTGGTVISILSNNWRKKQNTKPVKDFINLLNSNKIELIELNEGFKEIGLKIDTCILKLKKEDNIFNIYNYDVSIKQPDVEIEPIYMEDFERVILDYEIYKTCSEDKEILEISKKKYSLTDLLMLLK